MRLFLKPQTAQSFDIKIESPEAFHFDLLILPFRSANESIKNQILFSARSNSMQIQRTTQRTCWGHRPFGCQGFACEIGWTNGASFSLCTLYHIILATGINKSEMSQSLFFLLRQHNTALTVHAHLTSPPHLPFVSLAARQLAARSLLGLALHPLEQDLIHENNHHSDVRSYKWTQYNNLDLSNNACSVYTMNEWMEAGVSDFNELTLYQMKIPLKILKNMLRLFWQSKIITQVSGISVVCD